MKQPALSTIPALSAAIALAGCGATQPDTRNVYVPPLGEPQPTVFYRDLTREPLPPLEPRPRTAPVPRTVSQSVVPANPDPEPVAEPPEPVIPVADTESLVSEAPDAPIAETSPDISPGPCNQPALTLAPGSLRTSLALALSDTCGIDDFSWQPGNAVNIFDWPLSESVEIQLDDNDLSGLSAWLETHYGLRAEWPETMDAVTVTGPAQP